MDEEELEQPSSKINVGSFFERVDSVDRVANRALSRANANLGIINNQQLIIQSLSVSIEAMETKIRDIANYIIIEKKAEKDAADDRLLEQEDKEQKQSMLERALKGDTGPKGDPGKPAEQQQQGGGGSFLGGLLKGLATLGISAFALKYIGPVLLPKLLLLAKTKLIPIIGTALKGAFTKLASLLGATLKGLVAKIPVVGKALAGGGLIGGISAGIAKIGSFISNALSGKGGGQTSDSNLNVDSSPVNEMTDTLTDNNLVENEENKTDTLTDNNLVENEENKVEENQKNKVEDSSELKLYADYIEEGAEIEEIGKGDFSITYPNGREQIINTLGMGGEGNTIEEKFNSTVIGIDLEQQKTEKRKKEVKERLDDNSKFESDFFKNVKGTKINLNNLIQENKEKRDLSLLDTTNNRVDTLVQSASDVGNKDQNQGVISPLNTSQTSVAEIKTAKSDISFVRLTRNDYISVSPTSKGLPPEVLKRLT